MGFALNDSVTLTFDLVTLKFVGVIYWLWQIFLPRRMTVSHKLLKILSGQGFYIKCYCDLDIKCWHIDLIMYRGHLLNITNRFTEYHDYHSENCQDFERTWFMHRIYCDLELWPSDLKMYMGHLLIMTNLQTKY